MGSATPLNSVNEVKGHAYSIIGVHDLKLANGTNVKLIKIYNPWNKEVWDTNPWADNSKLWTLEIKQMVNYVNGNDGIFHVTPSDYLSTFCITTWGKVRSGYQTSFIDIPIDHINLNTVKNYQVDLLVGNNVALLPVMVYIDLPNPRLLQKCGSPYDVHSIHAYNATNNVINPTNFGEYVVSFYQNGKYTFVANIENKKNFSRCLTITAYHPKNVTFEFKSKTKDTHNWKDCTALKRCNGKGKCNYFSGTCVCIRGVRKTQEK